MRTHLTHATDIAPLEEWVRKGISSDLSRATELHLTLGAAASRGLSTRSADDTQNPPPALAWIKLLASRLTSYSIAELHHDDVARGVTWRAKPLTCQRSSTPAAGSRFAWQQDP